MLTAFMAKIGLIRESSLAFWALHMMPQSKLYYGIDICVESN